MSRVVLLGLFSLWACSGDPGQTDTDCDEHLDCPGAELCIDNVCTAFSCDTDADCDQGQLCLSSGQCAVAQCRADTDCCGPDEPSCGRQCIDNACHCSDCTDGQQESCFRGCHRGNRGCVNGCWLECDAPPVLPAEECDDGIDNDCSGQVDDGCLCTPDATRACDSTCGPGTQTCDAGGAWGICDGDCCEPGQSGEQPCGNCGFNQGTCNSTGQWEWGAVCLGQGQCEAGIDEQADCGNCGTQSRTCAADCSWGQWSDCGAQGECEPTTTLDEACGTCGTWLLTCGADCQWDDPGTCNEGQVCVPMGPGQTRDCERCGTESRACVDSCNWGPWSSCQNQGPCEPGEITTEACGWCGECTRICQADCSWGPCGSCIGEGECELLSDDTQDCGPATDLGICEYGVQTRDCSPTCQWESWGSCDGAVYPEWFDLCGNGIDEDCDGSDYVELDDYEVNDTCGSCEWLGDDPEVTMYPTIDSDLDTADFFCFNAIDNTSVFGREKIEVTVTNQPTDMDVDIYLYKGYSDCSSQTSLASSMAWGNDDESITWEEALAQDDAGTYYVEVRNWGDPSCWSSYTLFIKGLR